MQEYEFSLQFILAPAFLWGVFLVVIASFAVISGIFVYHWKRYIFHPTEAGGGRRYMRLYFSVSGVFIIGMAIALAAYSS